MEKYLFRYFSKEDIQLANKCMKEMLDLTNHQVEMQIKTPDRMALIKKTKNNKF
jgi:CBS-domain-containing membrane protein